jgi:hypothetical protein
LKTKFPIFFLLCPNHLEAASFSGNLHDTEVDLRKIELNVLVNVAQCVAVAEKVAAFQSGRRRQNFGSGRHVLKSILLKLLSIIYLVGDSFIPDFYNHKFSVYEIYEFFLMSTAWLSVNFFEPLGFHLRSRKFNFKAKKNFYDCYYHLTRDTINNDL